MEGTAPIGMGGENLICNCALYVGVGSEVRCVMVWRVDNAYVPHGVFI